MKIAFYKGYGDTWWRKIVSAIMQLWTFGPYTHVELIKTRGYDDPELWVWYSASAFENKVRSKLMKPFHPKHWDIFDVEVDIEDEKTAFNLICSKLGAKYDWTGIFLTQIIPLDRQDKKKWFCSEIVRLGLCNAKIVPCDGKHYKYHPNALYRELKKLGKIDG